MALTNNDIFMMLSRAGEAGFQIGRERGNSGVVHIIDCAATLATDCVYRYWR